MTSGCRRTTTTNLTRRLHSLKEDNVTKISNLISRSFSVAVLAVFLAQCAAQNTAFPPMPGQSGSQPGMHIGLGASSVDSRMQLPLPLQPANPAPPLFGEQASGLSSPTLLSRPPADLKRMSIQMPVTRSRAFFEAIRNAGQAMASSSRRNVTPSSIINGNDTGGQRGMIFNTGFDDLYANLGYYILDSHGPFC